MDAVKLPEFIKTLTLAELVIRQNQALAEATPFLAHSELKDTDRGRFGLAFKTFVQRDASRILEALRRWPLVSVWSIAGALSQDYGEGGHAVYGVLERTFGVSLAGPVRNRISDAFRSVCRKYGLCFEGADRLVNDYLAQAGIANSQLHHVAKAFLLAERSFGPAPYENTAALNRWEDDAANFIPVGVHIPRMVLEVDQTAHYASLFARCRLQEPSRNVFEKRFFDEIAKALKEVTAGRHYGETVPKPSLVWSSNGLALSLPKVEGRLSITVNGETRKLRGGQNWPLSTPWPAHVDWSVGDHRDRLPVVTSDRHLLAFDNDLGRLVGQVDTTQEVKFAVDSREVMLAANSAFTVNGEPAFEVGLRGYAAYCQLGPAGAAIVLGSRDIQVIAKPRPRIWVESGVIAKGSKGPLLSGKSSLGIEFGELESNAFDLALAIDGQEKIVPLDASATGVAFHDLANESIDETRVVAIKAELRLRGSNRALVRYKAWLWTGLREFKDGLIFDASKRPANYAPEHSRHIAFDQWGRLCLDNETAYDAAILSCLVGQERVDFEIPRPGISITLSDPEGRSIPVKIGETLVIGEDEKAGSLSIRCPDSSAKLNVRGRMEPAAFQRSPTRVLSLADLMRPAPRDDVVVEWPVAGSVPIVLARIVPASAPVSFKIERRRDTLSLALELPIEIDAVRFSLESQTGTRSEYDCPLRQFPVPNPTPKWLEATLDFENTKRISATIGLNEFQDEFSLAGLAVRPTGTESFRPLRNIRGDTYAICVGSSSAVVQPAEAEDVSRHFITLNSWMYQCFAQQSWDHVGPLLMQRWMETGKQIAAISERRSLLLASAHLPRQPGTAKNWVPLSHPLQILPSLYSSPVTCFRALAENVSEGSEELALLAETAGRSIPEIHQALGLSPAFLMAFANFQEAHRKNLPLRGFSFERYRQLFQTFDTDLSARWFWRPGSELLGPAHYGAAIGRLIDRFYDAGLEEEGANDARIRAASSLAHAASRIHEPTPTLPTPSGIELTHGIFEFAPCFISSFAFASRHDTAADYLNQLGNRMERPYRSVIGDASFLLRLAPELFTFYLLLWELASKRQ